MKIIRPITFTASMLTSSNVTENDYGEWSVSTSYTAGVTGRCIVAAQHKVYEPLVDVTGGSSPEIDVLATPPKWVLVGSTNKYKMFNDRLSEQTTKTSILTVTIQPGVVIDSLALLNIAGTEAVITCTEPLAGTTYAKTVNLYSEASSYSPIVYDAYRYSFEEIVTRSDIVEFDIPPYLQQSIIISIKYQGGTAKCGACLLGMALDAGTTLYGGQLTLTDYSVGKEPDAYGETDVVQRGWAKKATIPILLKNIYLDIFYRFLSVYRAIPVVWVESSNYSCLIIYGYWIGPSFSLQYPDYTAVEVEIRGLTADNG